MLCVEVFVVDFWGVSLLGVWGSLLSVCGV